MSTFIKLPNDYIIETLHGSCILYVEDFKRNICYNDYYYYTIDLFRKVINEIHGENNTKQFKINIVFNTNVSFLKEYTFTNDNKTLYFNINEEHTFVSNDVSFYNVFKYYTKIVHRSNNRGELTEGCSPDEIEFYKIILPHSEECERSDVIINYSATNHMNFKISMDYKDTYKKMILIHPLLYPYYNKIGNRNINCLTTFVFPDRTQKRIDFLNMIRQNGVNHVNVNTCDTADDFITLYRNTKILLNIRQTAFCHTIEEFRILPALMSGVIVICEDGPLKEYIPYQNYIIWTTNENMIQTIRETEQNYEKIHKRIFSGNYLSNLLEIMAESNKHELYDKLLEYSG
jgi:hypothetical protein